MINKQAVILLISFLAGALASCICLLAQADPWDALQVGLLVMLVVDSGGRLYL